MPPPPRSDAAQGVRVRRVGIPRPSECAQRAAHDPALRDADAAEVRGGVLYECEGGEPEAHRPVVVLPRIVVEPEAPEAGCFKAHGGKLVQKLWVVGQGHAVLAQQHVEGAADLIDGLPVSSRSTAPSPARVTLRHRDGLDSERVRKY
jgi:hypothetical protein